MKPYLIVLKSVQLEACVAFYQSLGIAFEQASHDEKTIHYTTKMDSLVWELYPVNEGEQASNNRLGFQLSPEQTDQDSIVAFIKQKAEQIHDFGNGQHYAVMEDPDGRTIEVVYQQP